MELLSTLACPHDWTQNKAHRQAGIHLRTLSVPRSKRVVNRWRAERERWRDHRAALQLISGVSEHRIGTRKALGRGGIANPARRCVGLWIASCYDQQVSLLGVYFSDAMRYVRKRPMKVSDTGEFCMPGDGQRVNSTWLVKSCKAVIAFALLSNFATAQNLGSHAPPAAATGAERILIEQVEALSKAKQFEEAAATLEKLFEQSEGRLLEAEGIQRAATLTTQRYLSIRHWSRSRLSQLLIDDLETRKSYLNDHDAAAAAVLAELAVSKDLVRARHAAERFSQTTSGIKLQLLLADLYLERGWGLAALQTVQRLLPCMRFSVPNAPQSASNEELTGRSLNGSLAWPLLADQMNEEELRRAMRTWHSRLLQEAWQTPAPDSLAMELLQC